LIVERSSQAIVERSSQAIAKRSSQTRVLERATKVTAGSSVEKFILPIETPRKR
jgi:hypothetical protein